MIKVKAILRGGWISDMGKRNGVSERVSKDYRDGSVRLSSRLFKRE